MTVKSRKRIELANRVIELYEGSMAPMSFKELAQLVRLAETPEERLLPLAQIAANVIQRENARNPRGLRHMPSVHRASFPLKCGISIPIIKAVIN